MGQLGAAPARLAARRAGAGTPSKRGLPKGPRDLFSGEIGPHDPATTKRGTVGWEGSDLGGLTPEAAAAKKAGRVTRAAELERGPARGFCVARVS